MRNSLSLLIDSLENTSKLLWKYLIDPKHYQDVLDLLQSVYKAYEEPKEAWVTGSFYAWTRTRGDSLKFLITTLKVNGLNAAFVNELLVYLQDEEGGWALTSSNTQIMFSLIRQIPGYESTVDDAYLSIDVVKRMVDLLEGHAQQPKHLTEPVVNPLAALVEKKKAEVRAEISAIPKVDIANRAKQLQAFHNDSSRFIKKSNAPRVKLLKDNINLNHNASIVEQMLKNKQNKGQKPPLKPARKLSESPKFQTALQTIGMFHQGRTAASKPSVEAQPIKRATR